MMDKPFYRSMLLMVNDKDNYQSLTVYASTRIELLLQQLSTETDVDKIRALQGAIRELRRIKTLRDEVIEGAK